MAYNQIEAHIRADGILSLWRKLHEKVKNIESEEQFKELCKENSNLSDAFVDEVYQYNKMLKTEAPNPATIEKFIEMYSHILCVGRHLMLARTRLLLSKAVASIDNVLN